MSRGERLYLIREEILPESILKAARAKEMLLKGEASTVNEAVERVNLSRSAYYKYRNKVFPLYNGNKEKEITIYFTLEHRTGVLSRALAAIAMLQGNILTINQDLPAQGLARVCINLEITNLSVDLEALLNELRKVDGVKSVSLPEWDRRTRGRERRSI
jgi:chorismate mutase